MKRTDKTNITVTDFIKKKALGMLGLVGSEIDPRTLSERFTFVNNIDEIKKNKLREYNIWYAGDSDELMNFYTRANAIEYNYDPLYNRNKKSYFWCVSSTEDDVKRTHSGQPRNIVDTLVNLIGLPQVGISSKGNVLNEVDKKLAKILKDNKFGKMLVQQARPLTLVEGWGAWKINWNKEFSDTPILLYYRAEACDFIYRNGRVIAIIYKDYYQNDKKENYILFETRRLSGRDLYIEKELYKISGQSEILTPVELKELPQLRDVEPVVKIEGLGRLLGAVNIFFEDSTGDCYGRSIYTGKIDLFDDLDQCHSQAANTVRRSTVHEYFDVNFLEKDEHTGMPIMPNGFDRKYIKYAGRMGGEGAAGTLPIQVVQPSLNFVSYSQEEQNILVNIISGVMSPATLGIDIAKKDNAEAQREKEKVTIFTTNTIKAEEKDTICDIANDLLIADELMRTGECRCTDYDISVKYNEFSDALFRSTLDTVLAAWQGGIMTDELALKMLHGDTLGEEGLKKEIEFVKSQREKAESMNDPANQGEFGELGAENEYNDAMADNEAGLGLEDLM